MRTEAPNFSGEYPLAGERLGPAWRDLWERLSLETWQDGVELAHAVASACDVTPGTCKNLLRKAREAGILEAKQMQAAKWRRASTHYRVLANSPGGLYFAKP